MLDLLQWPALAVTIAAVWLVASGGRQLRLAGFALFLLSNALWAVWGWHVGAWAIVALQAALLIPNVRGVIQNSSNPPDSAMPDREERWSTRPDADYRALVRDGVSTEATEPKAVRQAA